jgi:hypothetical protein
MWDIIIRLVYVLRETFNRNAKAPAWWGNSHLITPLRTKEDSNAQIYAHCSGLSLDHRRPCRPLALAIEIIPSLLPAGVVLILLSPEKSSRPVRGWVDLGGGEVWSHCRRRVEKRKVRLRFGQTKSGAGYSSGAQLIEVGQHGAAGAGTTTPAELQPFI